MILRHFEILFKGTVERGRNSFKGKIQKKGEETEEWGRNRRKGKKQKKGKEWIEKGSKKIKWT